MSSILHFEQYLSDRKLTEEDLLQFSALVSNSTEPTIQQFVKRMIGATSSHCLDGNKSLLTEEMIVCLCTKTSRLRRSLGVVMNLEHLDKAKATLERVTENALIVSKTPEIVDFIRILIRSPFIHQTEIFRVISDSLFKILRRDNETPIAVIRSVADLIRKEIKMYESFGIKTQWIWHVVTEMTLGLCDKQEVDPSIRAKQIDTVEMMISIDQRIVNKLREVVNFLIVCLRGGNKNIKMKTLSLMKTSVNSTKHLHTALVENVFTQLDDKKSAIRKQAAEIIQILASVESKNKPLRANLHHLFFVALDKREIRNIVINTIWAIWTNTKWFSKSFRLIFDSFERAGKNGQKEAVNMVMVKISEKLEIESQQFKMRFVDSIITMIQQLTSNNSQIMDIIISCVLRVTQTNYRNWAPLKKLHNDIKILLPKTMKLHQNMLDGAVTIEMRIADFFFDAEAEAEKELETDRKLAFDL